MPAQTCTWLHLSDLHFRESTSWDANIVLQGLLKDIRKRVTEDSLRPDLIFVTGDIAYSGKEAEYRLAAAFFDELLAATSLGKDRLFVIPGNHDVNRGAITQGVQSVIKGLNGRDKLNLHFRTPLDRRAVFQGFAQFADFVNEYFEGHLRCDEEQYYYVRQLTIAKQMVAVLGLNSAWLSMSDEDRNRLALGEHQVRNALSQASGTELKIALLHHPFDWLYDFDREDVETLLQSECDFVLHGHMHRTNAQQLTTPDSAAIVLAAGACYETRAYPNTYHFVRLDYGAGRGTLFLRRYSLSNFWAKDTLTYKNAPDGEYSFPLYPEATPTKPAPASKEAAGSGPSLTHAPAHIELDIYFHEGSYIIQFEPRKLVKPLRPIPAADLPPDLPIDQVANRIAQKALEEHGPDLWQQLGSQGTCLKVNVKDPVWLEAKETELQAALEKELLQRIGDSTQPGEKTSVNMKSGSTQPTSEPFNEYDIATIRQLLTNAFIAPDLRRFCQDRPLFRPIVALFPNQSLADMVDAVIDYCRTQALLPELLSEIERANPRQFKRYGASFGAKSEPPPSAAPHPATEEPKATFPLSEVRATLAFEQGQVFFDARDWESAIARLEETLRFAPHHQEAKDLLRVAREEWHKVQQRNREEERLTALYERAQQRVDEAEWQQAGLLLEEVVRSEPTFRDAQALLDSVKTEIEREAQERQRQQTLEFYYGRAEQHLEAREWTEAIRFLDMMQDLEQDYRDVGSKLNTAYRNQQLDQWDREARQAADRGDWSQTIQYLRRIKSTEPEHPDLQERLEHAQTQEKLANLYAAVQTDLEARRWKTARDGLQEIAGIDEHYRDAPTALHYALAQIAMGEEKWDEALQHFSRVVQTARSYRDAALCLEEAQKQAQLSELYATGKRHFKAQAWEQAQSAFAQVLTVDRQYRDAAMLRERAEQEGRWANLYRQAERYLDLRRWEEALTPLRQIEAENPHYPDVQAKLGRAEREKQLADLYREGLEQIGEGQWREATLMFEQIFGMAPDYRDVKERLETASKKQQVVEHYDLGSRAYEARDWPTAIAALEKVVALDAEYPDAEVKLAEARKQQRLAGYYEDGKQQLNQEKWEMAIRCFQEVVNLEPRYKDAATLLAESRRQAELAQIYRQAQEAFEKGAWTQVSELLTQLPKDYHRDIVVEMGREAEKQQRLETLYAQAKQLYDNQQWREAIPILEDILELEDDYHLASQMLEDARYQLELNEHYRAGIRAFKNRDWDLAIEQLTWVVDRNSYYQDALTRLSEARRAKRLANLYASGQAHIEQQAWSQAATDLEEIVRIDSDYEDAQQQRAFCEKQARLQKWYEEGRTFLGQKQWKKAAETFHRITAQVPDYGDAVDQLALAEAELRLAGWYDNGCRYLDLRRWSDAIEQFAKVVEERSDYGDAAQKLEEARREEHLLNLWTRAHALLDPEQEKELTTTAMEQAIGHLTEIVSQNEAYRDGEAQALLQQTQSGLAALQERIEQRRAEEERRQQETLASLYTQAIHLLDTGQRREAIPVLKQLLQTEPDYRDAKEKLEEAQRFGLFEPVARFVEQAKGVDWAGKLEPLQSRRWVPVLIGASVLLVVVLCAGAAISLFGENGTSTPTSVAVVTTSAPTTPVPTSTSLPPTSQATHTAAAIQTTAPAEPTDTPVIAATDTSAPTSTSTATATMVPSPTTRLPTDTPTPSATPTTPPPPPPTLIPAVTGKIAFPLYDTARRTYDIYIWKAADNSKRRILQEASQPELSPDGNKIAFRSWSDSSRGLVVMNLDGSNRFNATNSHEDARPSWASNESLVLFSRKEADRNSRLYLEGSWKDEPTTLIQHGSAPAYGETPSWLGSGRIVYHLCNPGCGISVTDENGSSPQRLLDNASKTTPEGSPNGESIAFMSNRDGNWEIYVMNANGTGVRRLTDHGAVDGLPTWSPDGAYIAFVSNRTGNENWSVWAIRPDGTGLRKLFDLEGTIDGVVDAEATYSSAGWKEEQISWSP